MSEFLSSPLFVILISLVVSIAVVAGGGSLALWFLKKKQGYPREALIEDALRPYVVKGIIAAYRVSEQQVDLLGDRLRGVDKKLIAMRLYDLLPNVLRVPIPGGDVLLVPTDFIKRFFTEQDFADLIETIFGELGDFMEDTQGRFGEEVEELLKGLA